LLPRDDTLANNLSLELCEDPEHLKKKFARGRVCVDRLPMNVKLASLLAQLVEHTNQILQRAPKPIDRPHADLIDFASYERF
jgi:hypothetical protein